MNVYKSNKKNLNLAKFMIVLAFTISILIPPVYAQTGTILQIVPGDYSFRSGLELKTKYYQGTSTLLKEEEYFWDSEVPLLDNIGKSYSSLYDLYYDTIPWKAKAIIEKNEFGNIVGDVDFTVAIIPRLQGKMTKLCTGGSCKNYFVEYEYDNHSNIKTMHDYGTIAEDVVKTYEDDSYVYAWTTWTLNSKLTRLKGPLYVYDETPWDNIIKKTNYSYEIDPLYEELNMVTLPSEIMTTDISGRVLSYTKYDYENTLSNLQVCSAHMLYSDHAMQGSYHYGGLLENVYDYGGIKGHVSFDELYTEKHFEYDECGNLLSTTTEGPYTNERGMRVTTPHYSETYYDDVGYAFPETVSNLGNSTSNPGVSVSAEYYTFFTSFTEPLAISPLDPVNVNLDDVRSDKIKKIIDENGQVTQYEYDTLGRLTKVIRPGDEGSFTLKYDYIYDPTPKGNWKVLAQQRINNVQVVQTYYFYDGLGRLIQTQIKKDANKIIVSDIKYDKLGRKDLESKPYELTATFGTYHQPTWGNLEVIDYDYDALSRIVTITYPDGNQIQKVYSDDENKITIYDENYHWKDYYYDAFNNLIKVEEQQP